MTAVGQIGVLLETAPFREEIANGHDIETVMHQKNQKEECHALGPIQRQNIAPKKHALVGSFGSVKTMRYYTNRFL